MNAAGSTEDEHQLLKPLAEALGAQLLPADEMREFGQALLRRHASSVRLRADVAAKSLSFAVKPIPWYSLGFEPVEPVVRPSRTLDYAAGDFFLQDAGSMLALAACDADRPPTAPRLVCDLCAAPGGKASAVLESIGDGFLLANEPIKSRVAPLAYNLARTGSDRYCISSLDPEALAERLGGVFDLVLVDAPCSGQALVGKGKQSLAAVSAAQIEHSAQRARRILSAALDLVRPGGKLVLSTCTFAEAENESQIRWLLEQDGVTPDPSERLAGYASDPAACCYRLWPHRHDCAGSFAASLACDRPTMSRWKDRKRKQRGERLPAELGNWLDKLPTRHKVAGAVIWGWPEDAPSWVETIAHSGPELAYRTGQTWKPSHEAALRRDDLAARNSVELDDETAISYLRGQPISLTTGKGWNVVRHQGRALGWVKVSGGTGKNHLPGAARIQW